MVSGLHELGDFMRTDDILSPFLDYVAELGLEPYPAQEEAILELISKKHVILNTPTGSGKSLVAVFLHFLALAEKKRSFYTAPTKALVNEKFFSLCDTFGPERVGLLTGDASVNSDAPVICCTAEILSNMALRKERLFVDYVVMDEFHYYGDRERGVSWQIPLITMRDTVFLLMSATLGDTSQIETRLRDFTNRETVAVKSAERPVPLEFVYRDTPLHETIEWLLAKNGAPIYLVNFTQRECAEYAQNLMSVNVTSKDEKRAIQAEIENVRFDTPYGKEFSRFIRHGLGVHHGGLLPRYRRVVEKLAQAGLIKVISGTDTLGVGVNIPIRTVLIRQLYKFDGEKTAILSAREFHQIAGRAGRKGFDDKGTVVVQAPEWIIENKKIEAKIACKPHLKNKLKKKKMPPKAVHWDKGHFDRLVGSPPEPLAPVFSLNHGMLVNLLQAGETSLHPSGGYKRLLEIINRAHLADTAKSGFKRLAASLFRSLKQVKIVEVLPRENTADAKKKTSRVRVATDLQKEFSMNQALALYVVETIDLLDKEDESYASDLLTLVESILENPNVVLYKQIDRLKGELVGQLKAEGVDYEERKEKADEVEHPKPKADFIYNTFNAFAEMHPWVGSENIRPKSVAREIFEGCFHFNDYIRLYGLARSEGVLLRYLSRAYKTAVQTVPEPSWTPEFEDILTFLYGLLSRTDDSLIQEWELLTAEPTSRITVPVSALEDDKTAAGERIRDPLSDMRTFKARIRNEMHLLLKDLSQKDYDSACEHIRQTKAHSWNTEDFAETMAPYYEEYGSINITPLARQPRNTVFKEESPRVWQVFQKIIDPEFNEDWAIHGVVDLSDWPPSVDTEPVDLTTPLIEIRKIGI